MRKIIIYYIIIFMSITVYGKNNESVINFIGNFNGYRIMGFDIIKSKGEPVGKRYYLFPKGLIITDIRENEKIIFFSEETSDYLKDIKIALTKENTTNKLSYQTDENSGDLVLSQIKPLTKTKWGICPPFNSKMPLINGVKGSASHIGVAIAQLMRYWKYPAKGKGEYEYRLGYLILKADFNHIYNYEKMPYILKTYSDSGDINKVSQLIYDTTISVETNFYNYSKAKNSRIIPALTQYFMFSDNLMRLERVDFTDKEWFNIIKDELAKGRIVLYNLRGSSNYDHIALVDGYIETESEKLIHINLGCGGKMDGYYSFNSVWKFDDNKAQFMIINLSPLSLLPAPQIIKSFSFGFLSVMIREIYDNIIWDIKNLQKEYSFNVYRFNDKLKQFVKIANTTKLFIKIKVPFDSSHKVRRYIIKTLYNGLESSASKEIVLE